MRHADAAVEVSPVWPLGMASSPLGEGSAAAVEATAAAERGEQEVEDQPDDPQAAAADRDPAPEAAAPAAARPAQIVDVGRVELGVLVEPHRGLPGARSVIPPHRRRRVDLDRAGYPDRREAWQSGRMHSP